MYRRLLFFSFLLFIYFISNSQAAVFYVSPSGDDDANDGSSWPLAMETIQGAIDSANNGDEIWVKTGIYLPQTEPGEATPTDNRKRHILLKNGVGVYGGFLGDEMSRDERDIFANPTVLSGDIGVEGDSTDNSYHVVQCKSGAGRTTVIDGFTITLGMGTVAIARGGGMVVENSSPTISNCIFDNNTAITTGGGLALWISDALVENCQFKNNTGGHGGALSINGGSPEIVACTFQSNISGSGRTGGAIYMHSTTATVTNSTFFNNEADTSDGGAVHSINSNLVLNYCTFSENTARNGGGLSWDTTAPQIINSIFWGNVGTINDPQILTGATVSNSVIDGGYSGAGIVTDDPNLLPIADNGGSVETIALPIGSSARNIGSLSGAPTHDARGNERLDSLPDLGAYEYYTFRVEFISESPSLGVISGETLQFIDLNNSTTAVTAEARPGYHFYRWDNVDTAYSNHARVEITNVTENMILTAKFNCPPVASTLPVFATPGSLVTLSGAGSYDPDNAPVTPLSYQWTFVSASPSTIAAPILSDANTMDATFTPLDTGTYTFVLTVSDGAATDTASLRIDIPSNVEATDTPIIVKSDAGNCFISSLSMTGQFNLLAPLFIVLLIILTFIQRDVLNLIIKNNR